MWPQLAHWQDGRGSSPKERGGGVFIRQNSFLVSSRKLTAHPVVASSSQPLTYKPYARLLRLDAPRAACLFSLPVIFVLRLRLGHSRTQPVRSLLRLAVLCYTYCFWLADSFMLPTALPLRRRGKPKTFVFDPILREKALFYSSKLFFAATLDRI